MIEQEITRLVNQSEKKGRFIIQELDDEINVLEKSPNLPFNNVDKFFSKKTKHSSICNNNKIIHLLHNQSENANLNQNFSTFIFEENSKNWVDFDLVWRKFSQVHRDVSEDHMEKIFNYNDLKSDDDEKNSSYFNDSLNNIINNNNFDEQNAKLLLSNNEFNSVGDRAVKRPVNPSNDNLTNVQTTHDISHSNIADIGMLSNITSTQFKSLQNNEINFNLNLNSNVNSNGNNQNNLFNLNCNSNFNNNSCGNNAPNANFGIITNAIAEEGDNKANSVLNKPTKNDAISIAAEEIRANSLKEPVSERIINEVKYEKIENEKEKNKLNLTADNATKGDIAIKGELINASNLEALADSVKNQFFTSNNINNNGNNLNSNTLILEDIISSEAAIKNNSSTCYNKDIEKSILKNCDTTQNNNASAVKNNKTTHELINTSVLNSNKFGDKTTSKNNSAQKANQKEQISSSKIKNLEINFCEKRIINSPAFSPINSDYCHKFDKINLDLNSLVNENSSKKAGKKFKLRSSDALIFLEEYFKEEKNKNSSKRQKRIFSEFKPNRDFENKRFSNLKINNVNNFCFMPEDKKILNSKNLRKKKIAKANKKNIYLQISENLEIQISAGNNLEENTNDEKENNCFAVKSDEKLNKIFCENYIFNSQTNANKTEFVCSSCGNKNDIVD